MAVKDHIPVVELKEREAPPKRRQFLRMLLGTSIFASLSTFVYPVIRYVLPPEEADLGAQEVVAAAVNELKPNTAKMFRFGSKPGLLVRTAQGEYRAVSATCTHLSCTVQYRPEDAGIWCACHNGRFDLGGKNIAGPPPRPLEAFDVHVRGEEVFVSRKQEA